MTFKTGNLISFTYNGTLRVGTIIENSRDWFKVDYGFYAWGGMKIVKTFTKEKIEGKVRIIKAA
jgi:hypothetical protein